MVYLNISIAKKYCVFVHHYISMKNSFTQGVQARRSFELKTSWVKRTCYLYYMHHFALVCVYAAIFEQYLRRVNRPQ